ncbi:MAG TPA: hypothetical protein PLX89_09200, partial [Verrucomicrobiota bacterium]|nr:hypothetical protein [Verrucomicrobiota bacterium]
GGGGYWSQDSATVVLAAPTGPSAPLSVRWPGGHTTTSTPSVPTTAKEVRLSFTDQLELVR